MFNFRHDYEEDDSSINLKIEGWCTPKTETKINWKRYCQKLQKNIKQVTFNHQKEIGCDSDYFIDLDLRYSGIKFNKQSYFSCDIMLFKTEEKIKIELYLTILQELLSSDENMSFMKQKVVAS